MKRTFEFKDDKTSKFWSIEVNGNEFTVTYGKTGAAGQSQTKNFADNDTCTKEADKLIAEKFKKGYAEEGRTTALTGTEVEKAKQALDMLNKWLEGKGIEERIEFSKPVSQKEITKAEKELGVNIPPSYVEFVTKYGTFNFDGELLGRGSGNDTCLLSPTELVEQTNDHREEFAEYGDGIEDYDDTNEDEIDPDMDAYKILRDGLLYLASPKGECFEVFVISSADADGEMKVRHFDYSDLGMNDGWHEGDETFYSTIAEMVQLIKQKNE